MIAIIRITGKVKMKQKFEETLFRLGLRKKFSCVLIDEKDSIKIGMLDKIRNTVSYGKINKEVMIKLIEKRGKRKDKKEIKNAEKIAEDIEKGKEEELKPYFRLNSPRGGLKNSRMHYPKGVIGENKEINKLIEKML